MKCQYCGSWIRDYPQNGLCPNCGGALPPDTSARWSPPAPPVVVRQPVILQQPVVIRQQAQIPGLTCCSRCGSTALVKKQRGFGWAAGIIGFLFLPPFGLLFGLIGRKNWNFRCSACGNKWTRK